MVHPQGRDDSHFRHIDDVGRIQRSAQSHLQHHKIAVAAEKVQKGNGRDELKLRGVLRHGLGNGANLLRQVRQGFIRDHLPVHPDPLVKGNQIRRGIEPYPIARRLQHRGHAGTGTALAVGPGHMNKTQLLLGIAQPVQQNAHPVQPRRMRLSLIGVDIGDGLLSGHGITLFLKRYGCRSAAWASVPADTAPAANSAAPVPAIQFAGANTAHF